VAAPKLPGVPLASSTANGIVEGGRRSEVGPSIPVEIGRHSRFGADREDELTGNVVGGPKLPGAPLASSTRSCCSRSRRS